MDRYVIVNEDSPEWKEISEIARNDQSHSLWKNYQNIKPSDYEYMVVCVYDDIPSGFYGIFNDGRWPSNVSRMFNRTYLKPDIREYPHGPLKGARALKYTLDNFDKWGKDILFVSRGVQYDDPDVSWKKLRRFVDFLIDKTGYPLELDQYLYRCCLKPKRSCYQYIIWYDPKSLRHEIDIPKITKEEWFELPKQA